MYCMRCGRELKEGSTFCEDCLETMAACPVPSGTPIQLPNRTPLPVNKKKAGRKRRELSLEEQLHRTRSACRWLAAALLVAVLAFGFTAFLLLKTMNAEPEPQTEKGRNYTTVQRTHR